VRAKAVARTQLYAAYVLVDLVAIGAAVAAASALRFGLNGSPVWAQNVLVILAPVYVLLALNLGAFQIRTLVSTAFSIQRATLAFFGALTTALIIIFFLKASGNYSRLATGYLAIVGGLFIVWGRIGTRAVARRLLQGRVEATVLISEGASRSLCDADVVLDAGRHGLRPGLSDPQSLDRLGWYLKGADRVIVECAPERRTSWAATLKGLGIIAEIVVPELDRIGAIGTGRLGGQATAIIGRGPLGTRDRLIKRSFDIAVVLAALPVVLPVCTLVALAVKLDSKGPILFGQVRVGQGNRQFRMLKFRSMRTELLDPDGRVSTLRNDHRITRVGRFIRATSLDELPQFFNVLKGDMSIVGPRPHALASTAGDSLFWEVDERYWHRHAAKPGLTGLAQVRGHRGATESTSALVDRVQSDLEYLADWSIWRDIRILFWTVRVLLHPNAY
jgi:lipopolysaccharide/colanic/teichoic acid biosynthesis glycosyltransferase